MNKIIIDYSNSLSTRLEEVVKSLDFELQIYPKNESLKSFSANKVGIITIEKTKSSNMVLSITEQSITNEPPILNDDGSVMSVRTLAERISDAISNYISLEVNPLGIDQHKKYGRLHEAVDEGLIDTAKFKEVAREEYIPHMKKEE